MVVPGDIIEINFVRSFGGICAMRFVGTYGNKIGESDWLGKIPTAGCNWYGEINIQNEDDESHESLLLNYNVSQYHSRVIYFD